MTAVYTWDDISDEDELGSFGERMTFKNKQGLDLTGYFWPAEDAKAVVIINHGHGSFLPYEYLASQGLGKPRIYKNSWVEKWNLNGYSVCGFDVQSHGRSEGARGLRWYFESFDDLVDDLLQFRREEVPKRNAFKNIPVFLCGISMGGCLVVETLLRVWDLGEFAGAALLSPMLSLEQLARNPVNRILRPLSSLMNVVWPTLAAVKVAKNPVFPELQEQFDTDPYTSGNHNTRVRVAVEYLRVTSKLMSELSQMKFDFIVFHSKQDTMTDPDGSRALYEKSKATSKTMTSVDSMWHFLTHEDGNEDVQKSITSWMESRLHAM
mmetsp:Transcript_36433/g.86536  ORF Transcript_36433/g.86536 Transcript_36433/m.86536 type:complete len:322 (-) Transcript_36433:283-1248(-)